MDHSGSFEFVLDLYLCCIRVGRLGSVVNLHAPKNFVFSHWLLLLLLLLLLLVVVLLHWRSQLMKRGRGGGILVHGHWGRLRDLHGRGRVHVHGGGPENVVFRHLNLHHLSAEMCVKFWRGED